MNSPLISIITASYNSQAFIQKTIDSVIAQTYIQWEMIIVDDYSSDNSLSIIETYIKKDTRIKLIKNSENQGVAESRNSAIQKSKGDYIALLDADDIWFPQKLTKQIQLMQTQKVLMSYSAYNTINEQDQETGSFLVQSKISYQDLLKTSSIGTLTMIYNAKILGKFYFENIGHEDYLYKLKIIKRIPFALGIQEPLAYYRISHKSLSSNKLKASLWQWKIYRQKEKLSLHKSIYYFLHYTYNGIFKYKS